MNEPKHPSIARLIETGKLDRIEGGRGPATELLDRAHQLLNSARALAAADPQTSFILAYDAAKHAGMAALAAMGLRTTQRGGHLAIEHALMELSSHDFSDYRMLRRRRNDLDYPTGHEEEVIGSEAERAIERAGSILASAESLVPQLTPR